MSRRILVLGLWLVLATGQAGAQVVLSPTRYELGFELDYAAEVLRGTARIAVENPSTQPVCQASLLLYRLLQVRSVRNDEGTDLAFSQAVVAFEDFGKLQVNQILVALQEPLAPGAQTTIRLQYDGHLLGYAETGMLYIKDRIDSTFTILREDAWAYPQPGYPSMAATLSSVPGWRFSYSARITVPKGFTVANGGRLEGTDTQGDRVAFRFTNLKPCWRMDFAIAKYGELTSGPIRVYYLSGDSSGARGVVQAAGKALDLFSRWFGPLQEAAGLAFIEIPEGWGSQADVTAVIQSADAFRNPKQLPGVYHEVSHLWNVTETNRPSPRWNEGLASFLEGLVSQEVTGEPVVDQRATELVDRLRRTLPGHPEWKEVPLVDYGRRELTDLSYSVGALYFDLLYRLVGRETFGRIIGGYVAEFSTRGGSTDDLMKVVRQQAKIDLSQLNADFIYTTAWADRIEQTARIQELEAYYRGRGQEIGK